MLPRIPPITLKATGDLPVIKLRDEVRKSLQQLSLLESAVAYLTNDATTEDRWRISSEAVEFVSKAQRAIIQLELLLSEVARHWPD